LSAAAAYYVVLHQGSAKSGPRAKSRPRASSVRPAAARQFLTLNRAHVFPPNAPKDKRFSHQVVFSHTPIYLTLTGLLQLTSLVTSLVTFERFLRKFGKNSIKLKIGGVGSQKHEQNSKSPRVSKSMCFCRYNVM